MRLQTRSGSIVAPAAGAGFAYQFSPNRRTKIESLVVTLTTSATVGTRAPVFELADPNSMVTFYTGPAAGPAASSVVQYVLSPIFGAQTAMAGPAGPAIGLPWPNMWVPPGWQLMLPTASLQAGDQLSAINFAVHYGEDAWDQDQDAVTYATLLAALG